MAASDAGSLPLTYSADNLPAGLSMNSATGALTGTLSSGDAAASPYAVGVTVSDGTYSNFAAFTWTVPLDQAPAGDYRIRVQANDGIRPAAVTAETFLVTNNVAAFVSHGLELSHGDGTVTTLTTGRAAVTLVVYVGVILAVATALFRRRDVT